MLMVGGVTDASSSNALYQKQIYNLRVSLMNSLGRSDDNIVITST